MKLRNGVNVASWIEVHDTDHYICNSCGAEVSIIRDYCPKCGSAMTVTVIHARSAEKTKEDILLIKKHIMNSIYGMSAAGRDGSSIFSDRIYVDTDSVGSDDNG